MNACTQCGLINDYHLEQSIAWQKVICNGCNYHITNIYNNTKTKAKMDSILLNGSICLTDLIEHAQKGHSAFTRAKNGKVYVAFTEWVNETPNEHGQHASLLLNSTKEKKEAEGKIYIGNGKKSEKSGSAAPVKPEEAKAFSVALDALPF